jgi:hypothetical protein
LLFTPFDEAFGRNFFERAVNFCDLPRLDREGFAARATLHGAGE